MYAHVNFAVVQCNIIQPFYYNQIPDMGINELTPMSGMSLLSGPLSLLSLQRSPIALAQILQPLRLLNLRFHLYNQRLQLLLALLAGVSIDITGVLFAVGPLGGIAALKEVGVDLGDTAVPDLRLRPT